jgi:phosphoglycolate phosphatase
VIATHLRRDRIDAAILDLDGTLVDTLDDFEVALNRSLSDLELPRVEREFIAIAVGKGTEHLLRGTLHHVGAAPEFYDRLRTCYRTHYSAINGQHARVYPGVHEGLARLRQLGLRLACLTNKPTDLARALLINKSLDHDFEVIFGGDAFERLKPDPLPLRRTCEALGTMTTRTLMIGDSSNDAKAARAAGCPVVLVTYGYNHGEPLSGVDADAFIDRLDRLVIEAVP